MSGLKWSVALSMPRARLLAVNDILPLLSSGADAVTIVIGFVLIRMERRITRLELRVFGFQQDLRRENER